MLNYTLFAGDMQIFDVLAEDKGDAEKQLTMFAISLTKFHGNYTITNVGETFYLTITGVTAPALSYRLYKQQ